MSNWLDPAIIVAIVLGAIANMWYCINLYLGQKEKRREQLWEEYSTNIVDPMRVSLNNLQEPARYLMVASHTDTRPDAAEWKEFNVNLAWRLNAVEIACGKADKRPETIRRDWRELADRQNKRILDLGSSDSAECDLESVCKQILSYDDVFEDRLHKQWRAMTGISNAGLFARSMRFPGKRRS